MTLAAPTPPPASWDFPRQVGGLEPVLALAAEHGLDRAALLRRAGLEASPASGAPDVLVTARQELAVLAHVSTVLQDAGVPGVELGRRYHLSTFGPLGYGMLASATVGAAMELGLRFIDLSHSFAIPRVSVSDADVHVALEPPTDVSPALGRFLAERDLAAIVRVLREVDPDLHVDVAVDLRRDAPADLGPYLAAFGAPPRFGRPADRLTFAASVLEHRLPQAHDATLAWCARVCDELASARRTTPGVVQEVRTVIGQHLPGGAPMSSVARALGWSERTLRRRLGEAGASYREVLDDVRRDEALALVEAGTDLDDAAERLGYAEAGSLAHAFRRWTGTTPQEHRRAQRA